MRVDSAFTPREVLSSIAESDRGNQLNTLGENRPNIFCFPRKCFEMPITNWIGLAKAAPEGLDSSTISSARDRESSLAKVFPKRRLCNRNTVCPAAARAESG